MTGNDVTCPHVNGSDPEVASFDRKSPGSGCRRPIGQVLGTFEHLQFCNSQEVESCDTKTRHVTAHAGGGSDGQDAMSCDWK